MSRKEQFIRLLVIIEKLRSSGEASFQEVSDYLKRRSQESGYNLTISQRGFQRDVNDIASIFDIEIKNNSSHHYFIEYEGHSNLHERMFKAFDFLPVLKLSEDISSMIYPEKQGSGTENIFGFLHAIKNRFTIKFIYHKYWGNTQEEKNVEPLALKEFRNRWYLLAKDKNKGMIRTYALDRISEVQITKEKFKTAENNINGMFRNCFGIVIPEKQKTENVVLSFTPLKGKYLKSLPLHESQKILVDNENEFRIQLHLYITHDFIRELLYHSEEMEVISPVHLRKELKRIYKIGLNQT
jgi:predicted DNA-binding transcriptional regulator YafY